MAPKTRLAPLFAPRPGGGYELFDVAFAFWALVLGSYLLGSPSPSTSAALTWLLGPTSLLLWGIVLNASAIAALACGFVPRAVPAGRGIVWAASGAWSVALLIGWVADANPGLTCRAAIVVGGLTGWALLVAVVVSCVPFPTTVRSLSGQPLIRRWRRLVDWSPPATVARVLGFTVLVAAFSTIAAGIGDPRQLAASILFGWFCRGVWHQTHLASCAAEAGGR